MSEVEDRSSRELTPREVALLERLLSDPYRFPLAYKTWLVSFLEMSDMNLPMSAIAGLTRRFESINAKLTTRVVGGLALGNANATGQAVIPFGQTFATGSILQSVVVSCRRLAHKHVIYSVVSWTATDFTISMWDTVTNAPVLEGEPFQASWQLLLANP